MAEPEEIVEYCKRYFSSTATLKGKTVLVTAGPTYEAIDAVRFIGNHSSGKMGVALAEKFASCGGKSTFSNWPKFNYFYSSKY